MFRFWKKGNKKAASTAPKTQALAGKQPGTSDLDVVVGMKSDPGCVRESNEDNGRWMRPDDPDLIRRRGTLVVVADGMGGHSSGEIASRVAVDVLSKVYYEENGEAQDALVKAVHKANREIFELAEKDGKFKGMGTTCTALVLRNGTAISAHVGDSRIYLIRNGQIYLLTEDHSAVREMVRQGIINLEDARHHPDKNVILRAVGSHPEVEVTTWDQPFPVSDGDHFLLCSDGLYDLVEDEEIKKAVLDGDPHSACDALVELARERGGHDNITVGVVRLKMSDEAKPPVRETREVEVAG